MKPANTCHVTNPSRSQVSTSRLSTKSLFTSQPQKQKKQNRVGLGIPLICPSPSLSIHQLTCSDNMTSHASLAKLSDLSHTISPLTLAASLAAEQELARQRFLSQSKLKNTWENIFAKYSQDFDGIADEIDQATGEIVVDNGHVRGMDDNTKSAKDNEERELRRIMGGGKAATEKVKRPLLWDGMRLATKRDNSEDSGSEGTHCEACRLQDELDDSVCLSCLPRISPLITPSPTDPATAAATVTHLALDSASVPSATPVKSASTMAKFTLRKSPRASLANDGNVLVSTGDDILPNAEDIPSDAFILEKLGSRGAVVVDLLAKARAQGCMSSPVPIFTGQDDTPGKSRTSYTRGDRIEVEISPSRARPPKAPSPAMKTPIPQPKSPKSPNTCIDQAEVRTWTPTKVTTWMLANGILHDVDDIDLARAVKKHQVSGAVIFGNLTFRDLKVKLEILSFSKRMQLWSGILKLKALAPSPPRRSQRHTTSPLFNSISTETQELSVWDPPPIQDDPFYSHIWRDEHPDGTPAKFPPRMVGPIFLKAEPGVSNVLASGAGGAKKGVKRKRESLAGGSSEPLKVEDVTDSPPHPAKKSARRKSLPGGVLKSPGVTDGERTPRTRTPAVNRILGWAPATRTPTPETATSLTPVARTPATKARIAKTPTKATPMKTPAKSLTPKTLTKKTPTSRAPNKKTPAPKTPAPKPPPEGAIPGWTAGSIRRPEGFAIGRSFLGLGGNEGDDELSICRTNSSPVPVQTTKGDAAGEATVKEECDDGSCKRGTEDGKMQRVGQRKEHKCNGGFCFVCLNLDGEEDDLI